MKLHADHIRADVVRDALAAEIEAGRIAPSVRFKVLREVGTRSGRAHAVEVQLESTAPSRGRRVGNSGSYGAMRAEVDGYAATYDEWGWLLAALYRLDPHMIVGTAKRPVYADRVDFNHKTGLTYDPWAWYAVVMEWPTFADDRDPYPYIIGKAVRTRAGYIIGRRGADRRDADSPDVTRAYWPIAERPRTVAEVLEFAHLTAEEAANGDAVNFDTSESASRQHYIDTGRYMTVAEVAESRALGMIR